MKQLTCEMCGSTELIKQDGLFVCQTCGCKYSVEEAKKMMIEGTVEVQGTVKVDNTAFVEKYLANARRALNKEDWSEVEKYYNMVEQNEPENKEAIFYSAYAKLRLVILEARSPKWYDGFKILRKAISVLDDYYDVENDKEDIELMERATKYICLLAQPNDGVVYWHNYSSLVDDGKLELKNQTNAQLIPELRQTLNNIKTKYQTKGKASDQITNISNLLPQENAESGCYVATCVYGSYDCPQVWTLRRYRDNTLGSTWYGRAFIRTYYAISPTLVKWFGKTKWFKKMWKGRLDRMVAKLQNNGVEDTPYEDKEW